MPAVNARADIEAGLLEIVKRETGRDASLDERLSSLGIDSLDLAHLIDVIERRFEIQADDEILDVDTLDELVQYIEARSS